MEIWYIAVEKFDPSKGDKWRSYIQWSGLKQLNRVLSLDGILNPPILDEFTNHNIQEDFATDFWGDIEYLISRLPEDKNFNVYAVIRSPENEVSNLVPDERFSFVGYDLVDKKGGISVLTNCGGFPNAFHDFELSGDGLLKDYNRAGEVHEALMRNYAKDNPHADCLIWAIWLMEKMG